MKKNLRKSLKVILPLLLVVMIVAGCMGATVTPGAGGGNAFTDVTGTYSEQFAALMKDNLSNSVQKIEDNYETRTVLISLSQKSLMDYAGKQDISSYASSEKGKEKTEKIHAQQDKLLQKLKDAGIEYELEYRYVAVANAVAVKIDTAYVSQIKKMSGVDSVVVSKTHAAPKTVETINNAGAAVVNATSVYKTGVYDSSLAVSEGLDGSGMVVAVIDTGLDYTHSAFQDMPNGVNPSRFTKEYVASILASKNLSSENLYPGLAVDDVYYNEKVPFMFDYADNDPNVYPSYSNHGTHVAGIVAGHDPNGYTDKDGNHVDEEFWGVAPEAQLVICKVFTDDLESNDLGGAETEDILAALEDCVMLGVDVINMSLGTTCGFTTTDDGDSEGDLLNKVYTSVGDAGISLICAASNDYSAHFGGTFGTNLATNPDSGTVGSPSTFPAALSVASISGKKSNYLLANGKNVVFFQNSNDGNSNPFDFIDQVLEEGETTKTFEYVVIPGVGLASDYSANIQKLVKGRIALVKRGDSSFQEKVELAMQFGAVGIIVYNNVSGTVRMTLGDIDDPIPAISIDMESGEAMVSGATNRVGTVVVDTSYAAGPFMSDFSSWGATADLKLKPEITAHGGEITSTVPGGYTEMSGTSMASPNMAGVVALLRSYVVSNFPEIAGDSVKVNRLLNQLMMSTATTVLDEKGLPYSPRKQGAGLGSLDNSRHTMAYLWTNNEENDYRPKIELGDDKDKKGVYSFSFNITNFGSSALSFKTNALFMTETLSVDGLAVAEQAYLLTDVPAQWVVNGENVADGAIFTVPAGQSYEIKLTLTLSDAEKKYIDDSFANGMFVEGFAKLLSESEGQCDLVLPFMGFYGDWSKAPMLDYDAYELGKIEQDASIPDDEKPQASVWATQPYVTYYDGQYTLPMGSYLYLQDENADQIYATMEHNSISRYNEYFGDDNNENYLTSYKFRGLYAGLLRSARYVNYKLTNTATGEVLETDTVYRVGKAYTSGGSGAPAFVKFETDPTELGLVSGEQYTMSFEFYLDYENEDGSRAMETYEFSFYADYEAPVLQDVRVRYYDYKDGNKTKQRIYLDIDVHDNHYAQSVMLTYLDGNELKMATEYVTPVQNANKNGTTTVSIEITDIYDQYKDLLYVQLDDYALNHSQYWLNLSKCNQTLAPDYFELADGEDAIELDIFETHKVSLKYEGDGNLSNFDWSSNNRAVAEVRNGEIVGLSAGTATITVTGSSGIRHSIKVTVTEEKTKLPIPSISFGTIQDGNGSLTRSQSYAAVYPGDTFQLNVNTDPWYYPDDQLTLKWESTNEKVATVDQEGNVITLAKGTAVIKAIIMVDGAPTAYTATMTLRVQDPFEVNGVTLVKYHGKESIVEIPTDKNIMMISEDAFKDNDTMTEIVIPKTVMQIGKEAFKNCTALKKVYFVSREAQEIADADLNIIYQQAFMGCTALELVDFTNVKIVTLGRECFRGCTSLTEVRAMPKATTLYNYAFADCTSLQTIDLSGLYVCGVGAFSGCTGLTNVTTAPATNIGALAFENCTGLTKLTLSASQIGDYAFYGCANLRDVTFAPVTGESSLSAAVGNYAFYGCSKLTKVTFAEGTEIWSIGDYAFAKTSLRSFTMPDGLTVLGADILSGSDVKQIIIGDDFDFDSIRLIGLVTSELNVELEEGCSKYVVENGVIYSSDMKKLLLVIAGTKNVTIPETVEVIGDYAFAGSNVASVTIPESVKTLGEAAFKDSNLVNLTFAGESTITKIPAYAFSGAKIRSIQIPASVTSIEQNAFADSGLASISFAGNAITGIGDSAFYNCTNLTSVTLPDGISEMGDGVFRSCTQLREVTMPSVQKLGINTFYGCTSLQSVRFGENATTLGDSRTEIVKLDEKPETLYANTFYGCSALKFVIFGEKITKIDDGVFAGCTALETIDLKKVTAIGNETFAFCSALTTVNGLERVKTIGDYAFYNCNGMEKLNLGSAEIIGNYAFAIANDGKAYTEISIPVARQIGNMAFFGGNEKTVNIPTSLEKLGYGVFAYSKRLTGFTVSENDFFFQKDGVLFNTLSDGKYELCAFPGALSVGESYTIPDGTARIASYAFAGLSKKAPEKVILPWSVNYIGVSAFYNSGIRNYTFNSINAPVLGTEFREDVIDLMENANSNSMAMGEAAINGLFYANFDTLMVYYTAMLGQTSDMVMAFPENGKGYDNYVWTTYFGERNSLGILMDDTTRAAIEAIKGLDDLETVKQWLNWEVNEENKAKIEAFAALVKDARRLYNNISGETQMQFVSEELATKLSNIEDVVRSLKAKFNIALVIDTFRWNEDYKKEYKEGESFDLSSLVLTIIYDDGSTEVADMSKLTLVYPTEPLTQYDQEVRFEYRDGNNVKEVRIPVTVKTESAGEDTKNEPGTTPGNQPGEEEPGNSSTLVIVLVAVAAAAAAGGVVAFVLIRKKRNTATVESTETEQTVEIAENEDVLETVETEINEEVAEPEETVISEDIENSEETETNKQSEENE